MDPKLKAFLFKVSTLEGLPYHDTESVDEYITQLPSPKKAWEPIFIADSELRVIYFRHHYVHKKVNTIPFEGKRDKKYRLIFLAGEAIDLLLTYKLDGESWRILCNDGWVYKTN